jgi:hypothetical protein
LDREEACSLPLKSEDATMLKECKPQEAKQAKQVLASKQVSYCIWDRMFHTVDHNSNPVPERKLEALGKPFRT